MKQRIDNYFDEATRWSDDMFVELIASRNRYRFVFIWSLFIISLMAVAMLFLFPLKSTELLMVHHADDGVTWNELIGNKKPNLEREEIEADIVRYVINRESYDVYNYEHQFSLVNLLSSSRVAKQYQSLQQTENSSAPVNIFNTKFTRSVHIQNIIFLRNDPRDPLAQVNFTVNDRNNITGLTKRKSQLALVSWRYHGAPKEPSARWNNWDGFEVTHYTLQQRYLDKE